MYYVNYGKHQIPYIDGLDWSARCEGCECHSKPIPSDGPVPARIFLIGERPGADEALKSMRPFTGKSGRELNENYLGLAGLSRDEVYIANTAKCFHPKNSAPGKGLIESCSQQFLPREIAAVNPSYIIPMGGTACSLFDNINLAMHHGMPLRRSLFGRTYWVIPMYHPALGLHDPKKMTPMLEDWARLRLILDGEYRYPVDNLKKTNYRLITGGQAVLDYLLKNGRPKWKLYGGLDTETDAGKLWCVTVCNEPGTGIMFLASDLEAMEAFRSVGDIYHWFIHNAIFDLDKLAERDIHLHHVTCTMQAVYHRGNLPQGLKILAWRLLGIEMTEYEDIVIPHSKVVLNDWWVGAMMELERADTVITKRFHKKSGKELKPDVQQSKLFKRMLQIYNHGQKGTLTYDMWKKYDELDKVDRDHIVGLVGKPPRASIVYVPMEDSPGVTGAITYSVRDADAGYRLGLYLRSQERKIRRTMSPVV